MARKNVLRIEGYVENDDVLIAIASELPPYNVCALISQILDITLIHNEYLSEENRLIYEDTPFFGFEERSLNPSRIEFYKYEFAEKEKKIFLVPNAQEILQNNNEVIITGTLFGNMDFSPKTFYLFPSEKQFDYLMKFDNYEVREILDIGNILVKSKRFRAVVATQTSKIKNVGPLYFLE